jgi:hypothetical protein
MQSEDDEAAPVTRASATNILLLYTKEFVVRKGARYSMPEDFCVVFESLTPNPKFNIRNMGFGDTQKLVSEMVDIDSRPFQKNRALDEVNDLEILLAARDIEKQKKALAKKLNK